MTYIGDMLDAAVQLGDGLPDGGVNSSGYTGAYDPVWQQVDGAWCKAYLGYVRGTNLRRMKGERLRVRPFDATWRDLWRRASAACQEQEDVEQAVTERVERQDVARVDVVADVEVQPCGLTFMRGHRAHKSYEKVEGELVKTDYDVGYLVVSWEEAIANLDALYARVKACAQLSEGNCFLVRGGLRQSVDGRKAHRRVCRGEEAIYEERDRRWCMLDVDNVPWPEGIAPGDGEGCARALRAMLPEGFHDAGMIWQWSNSAGLDGWATAKMHMFFWLDRPVGNRSWRAFIKARLRGVVDSAPFNPVQPHFIAHPRFEGLDDPCSGLERMGLIKGGLVKTPPELLCDADFDELYEEERAARARLKAATKSSQRSYGLSSRQKYAAAALSHALEKLRNALEGERHVTMRDETLKTWAYVEEGVLSEHVWREGFEATWQAIVPKARWSELERAMRGAKKKGAA